ncbi:MAG: antitoxin [Anaerolineae bacterium]|jgi:predicted DNA binding CopG/RHH family protein|nr:antitoxin [Anaerolineae bacterium]MBT7075276.1 antitoxin [Anaerolineae bacterium]MBT7782626.1 antitoxin [Anaerolineae bacterium]
MTENKLNLTKEEKDILLSYEADEWKSVENHKVSASKYEEYADATFKKDRRVNIRISTKNLEALQEKALEEGIPYQTLISSILHKYISGRLLEQL